MSGSGDINWTKRNRMLDGVYGQNPYRGKTPKPTTQKQMKYIFDLIDELENHGVPAKWILDDGDYAKCSANAITTIRVLRQLKRDNGLYAESKTYYINLCKHKETGKKIKYRTTKFCGAPKDYEFLGMLSRETVML